VSDFGPKISFRIVDTLREEIRDGKLKSGAEIKVNLISRMGFCFQFYARLHWFSRLEVYSVGLSMVAQATLKRCILELLTSKGGNSELNLGFRFCSLLPTIIICCLGFARSCCATPL
jgi:fused signal recognition particle receptor